MNVKYCEAIVQTPRVSLIVSLVYLILGTKSMHIILTSILRCLCIICSVVKTRHQFRREERRDSYRGNLVILNSVQAFNSTFKSSCVTEPGSL